MDKTGTWWETIHCGQIIRDIVRGARIVGLHLPRGCKVTITMTITQEP